MGCFCKILKKCEKFYAEGGCQGLKVEENDFLGSYSEGRNVCFLVLGV